MGKMRSKDKILIENLRWSSRRFLSELPRKGCARSGLDNLLRRIDASGSSARQVGSRRPKSARTAANIVRASTSGVNVFRQLCRTLERTLNIYLND